MLGHRVQGHKLRLLRERAGLTMHALSVKAGCSKGHLRNIETRNIQPSIELAHRFAAELSAALGRTVSIDDFSITKIEQAPAGAA